MKIITSSFLVGLLLINLMSSVLMQPANKMSSKVGKGTKLVPFPGFLQNDNYGAIDHDRYNIDLAFGVANLATVDAFGRARDRWMKVITGDLPNVDTSLVGTSTVLCHPPDVVDDLHVCILELDINVHGGFLAATYKTFVWEGTSQTILGVIELRKTLKNRYLREISFKMSHCF